ncbi:MAG: chromosome segregation protein SMC, partial [Anaerolineales bacterium]
DVTELLAQSGLAERTYTIIGQGVVDAALALKAEERRRLFEEAAGIGLYRTRREEAVRRLETTRRNLDRVQDILAELQPRLRSLERQARRANEYEQVRADLKMLLYEWYGYHWHRAQMELTEAHDLTRSQETALRQARRTVEQVDAELQASREHVHNLRGRLNQWHRQLAQLHSRQESLGRQLAVADERRRALETQQIDLLAERTRLEEELVLYADRLDASKAEFEQLKAEWQEAAEQLDAAQAVLDLRQAERLAAEQSLQEARQELSELNDRQVQLQAQQTERLASIDRLQQSMQDAGERSAAAEAALQEARRAAQEASQALDAASRQRNTAEAALQRVRAQVDSLEQEQKNTEQRRTTSGAELARLKALLDVLQQAEAKMTGYARGAQVLIQAARETRLAAASRVFGSQLEVPQELETAIAAALGEYLDSVLLEKESAVDSALDMLARQSARGVVLPLDHLAAEITQLPSVAGESGIVGRASELVSCPSNLRQAVDLLLGSTLVVRDRQAARRALSVGAASNNQLRAVTLEGEVFSAVGPVLSAQDGKSSTLTRTRQVKELRSDLSQVESRVVELDERMADIRDRLQSARQDLAQAEQDQRSALQDEGNGEVAYRRSQAALEQVEREIVWHTQQRQRMENEIGDNRRQDEQAAAELDSLQHRIVAAREAVRTRSTSIAELPLDELQEQVNHWRTLMAVAEQAANAADGRQQERQSSLEHARKLLTSVQEKQADIKSAIELLDSEQAMQRGEEAEVDQQITELRALIDPAEAELDDSEASQLSLQQSEAKARHTLSQAEHNHAQARIGQARRHEELETWRRRIEDDFGLVAFEYAEEISGPTPLPLQGLVEQLPHVEKLAPEVEENVRRQRALLRRIGPVNPEAQSEYHEVKERYQFMTEQVADLEKAENDVHQVISELDSLMERELRKTFEAVAGEFSNIFKRLFGGGTAHLMLTDPDDMTNTGIDIEARLPGRRMQGLSLLSGGERSLTAVSLVFALLKVAPTPFCVLDEVDAMLDEANVGRFRELLRELSQHTQFVIVTHNRNTVQVAEVIYGVTMGRD